jgi:hypothetical protein
MQIVERAAATQVTLNRQSDKAVLEWQPPLAGSRSPVKYRVLRGGVGSTGGGPCATTLDADARSFTFEQLIPESTYKFTVTAMYANHITASVSVTV